MPCTGIGGVTSISVLGEMAGEAELDRARVLSVNAGDVCDLNRGGRGAAVLLESGESGTSTFSKRSSRQFKLDFLEGRDKLSSHFAALKSR